MKNITEYINEARERKVPNNEFYNYLKDNDCEIKYEGDDDTFIITLKEENNKKPIDRNHIVIVPYSRSSFCFIGRKDIDLFVYKPGMMGDPWTGNYVVDSKNLLDLTLDEKTVKYTEKNAKVIIDVLKYEAGVSEECYWETKRA